MWEKLSKASIRNILGIVNHLLSYTFLFMLIFNKIPQENRDVITTLGGVLIGTTVTMTNWYFGSSKTTERESQ